MLRVVLCFAVLLLAADVFVSPSYSEAVGQKKTPSYSAAVGQTKTPKPILQIDSGGHRALIRDIRFTPDGNSLMSASDDKLVRVWDWRAQKTVRTIRGQIGKGHEGKIFAMALSPDGKYLAAGGYLGSFTGNKPREEEEAHKIRLYDFASGRLVALLKGHSNVVNALAFSGDGKRLISGSGDSTAIIWDTGDRWREAGDRKRGALTIKPLHRLKGHTDHIYAVGFVSISPSPRPSPPRGEGEKNAGRSASKPSPPRGEGLGEGVNAYNAITGSYDHDLRLWDAQSGRLIRVMKGHTDKVRALAVSSTGLIASGSWDHSIRLWDGRTGLPVSKAGRARFLGTDAKMDTSLSPSPLTGEGRGGGGAASAEPSIIPPPPTPPRQGEGSLSQAAPGNILADQAPQMDSSLTDVRQNTDGRLDSRLRGNDAGKKGDGSGSDEALPLTVTGTDNVLADQGTQVGSLSFSPDGRRLLSGVSKSVADSRGYHCHVFDIATGKERLTYKGHDNVVIATTISPDGRLAATGGGNKRQIHVWELPPSDSAAVGQTKEPSSSAAVGQSKTPSNSEAIGQSKTPSSSAASGQKATPGRLRAELKGTGAAAYAAGFSKDGNSIGWGMWV